MHTSGLINVPFVSFLMVQGFQYCLQWGWLYSSACHSTTSFRLLGKLLGNNSSYNLAFC